MRHLPRLGSDGKIEPKAACGAPAYAGMDTTVAECDCPTCLWGVCGFLQHQIAMVMARLRALGGVTLRVSGPPPKKKEEG